MSQPELRRVTRDVGDPGEHLRRRRFCQNGREQAVFVGARKGDVIAFGRLLETGGSLGVIRRSENVRGISDAA
jgi:hypothetical protein